MVMAQEGFQVTAFAEDKIRKVWLQVGSQYIYDPLEGTDENRGRKCIILEIADVGDAADSLLPPQTVLIEYLDNSGQHDLAHFTDLVPVP